MRALKAPAKVRGGYLPRAVGTVLSVPEWEELVDIDPHAGRFLGVWRPGNGPRLVEEERD